MTSEIVVYTPLRIALMAVVLIANLLAIISLIASNQPWAEYLGIFAVVFIMLFIFVILLEWTWLHHMGKVQEDAAVKAKYKQAKTIYTLLFMMGFLISYVVLL